MILEHEKHTFFYCMVKADHLDHLDHLDNLDILHHLNRSDNPDWSIITQTDNCRIRIVYLVLFSTPFLMWLQIPFCFILYWSSRSFLIWFQIPFTVNHYSCYMCLLIQIYLSGSSFDSAENDKRVLPRSPSPPLRVGLLRSSPSHDSPVSINKSAPI